MSIQKINAGDNLSQSENIVESNIDKLKALFPEIVTEGKIDFKVLQEVLGNEIEEGEEYYRFTWAGKAAARREAQKPSTGTLRPAPEESVDWDKTKNLYIEGDNLEVLKLLQKSYANKVKMIYIDPPYNTGNDFVYKDNYKDNLKNYQEQTGQLDSDGNKMSTNTDTDGRYHSNWLNMMYPRLKLARNLLKDDGVIFMSIGEDEVENLKKVGNEIFGEQNFVSIITRVAKRTSNKGTYFKPTKDYIICYAKKINSLESFGLKKEIKDELYTYEDEVGRYRQNGASLYQPSLDSRPNQRYYIEVPDGTLIIPPGDTFPDSKKDGEKIKPTSNNDKVWRWSRDTYLERKNDLIFTKSTQSPLIDGDGNIAKWNIYDKVYLKDDLVKMMLPEDIIYEFPNSQGTKEIKKLKIPFSFSKPSKLISFLISITKYNSKNEIVLDFFSGSATTAHAVMQLNAEDGGIRQHIQVQIPEPTEEKSEANKAGYKTITEIGKERIRRAGKLIVKDKLLMINEKKANLEKLQKESVLIKNEDKIESLQAEINHLQARINNLDIGFKVFKLDSSNIKAWDGNPDTLDNSLFDAQDNIKTDRTEADVLYEILLKYGLDLTLPIAEKTLAGKTVYSVGYGALFICLADKITSQVAEGIGEWKKELAPEVCRVVFKDTGFTDVEKTNSVQTLKRFGISEIKSI